MKFLTLLTVLIIPLAANAAEPIRCIEPSAATGTSRAVMVGNVPLIYTPQVLAWNDDRKIVGAGDAEAQAKRVLSNLEEILGPANSSLGRMAKLNLYAVNDDVAAAALRAITTRFATEEIKPAVSVVITRFPYDEALVAMDGVCVANRRGMQAVSHFFPATGPGLAKTWLWRQSASPPGRKIYVAGQAEKADDVKTATQKTMESLAATLKFLGRTNDDIVQLKCFVKPVTAESAKEVEAGMKAVLGGGPLPPVVLVEWESSLPIEIELVAWGGPIEAGMPAVEYLTPPGMTTPTVYSRVARTASAETIYVSGLFGAPGASAKQETEQLFAQLGDILKASGSDFRHLAKATYYVSTDDASNQLNALRPSYYDPQRPPAASKATVRGVGMPGRTTTLDMIAVPTK